MCTQKTIITYKPRKVIKSEPVARPVIVTNKAATANQADKAELYNFIAHKTGAGQCRRRKSGMLSNASREPAIAAII
jgi:hypothetical protein